jgi:O-antigen/teichoic acid export membrane protein
MGLPEDATAAASVAPAPFARVIQATAAYSALILAGRAASLLLLPIYTRQLATREYGALELIDLSVMLISTTLGVGVGADTLFYFYAKAADSKEKSRVAVTLLVLSLLAGVACSIAMFIGAGSISQLLLKSPAYEFSIQIAAATIAFSMLLEFGLCYFRATDRTRLFSLITVARLVGTITLNLVFLLVYKLGLNAILLSSFLVTSVLGVGTSIFVWLDAKEGRAFHSPLLKSAFQFSTPLMISSLCLLTVHYADRYFLSRFVSLGEIGIYSVAYKFGMLVSLLNVPFQLVWRPRMYALVGGAGGEVVQAKAVTYTSMFFIYVAVGYQLLGEYVIRLFVAPDYWQAAAYVPWVALAYAIYALETQLHNVFLVTAQTRFALTTSLATAVVCLAGYWLMIPRFRLWGAVGATLLAFVVMLSLSFYLSLKSMRVHYEYPKLLALVLVGVAVVLARKAVGSTTGAWGIVWSVGLACAYPAIVLAIPSFRVERQGLARAVRG